MRFDRWRLYLLRFIAGNRSVMIGVTFDGLDVKLKSPCLVDRCTFKGDDLQRVTVTIDGGPGSRPGPPAEDA